MIRTLLCIHLGACAARAPAVDIGPPAGVEIARVEPVAPRFDSVVLVSVDGLRSDALIAVPGDLPAFARLRAGASTLNARTDPDFTVTLPNHAAMFTGRMTLGDAGHGWTYNQDVPAERTLHVQRGAYLPGCFDVAHDHGLRTALFAGKSKFSVFDVSWNEEHGAPGTSSADERRDKIDAYRSIEAPEEISTAVIGELERGDARCVIFAHYALADLTGHARGWDVTPGSPYMQAVAHIDRDLGAILDAIEASPARRGRVAVVLTADHGGGAPLHSHDQPHMWVDYVIPFLVWTGDAALGADLYELNEETREEPGLGRPLRDAEGLPPIRNGDAANLLLDLLGLPPIDGSTINRRQDLRWSVRARTSSGAPSPQKLTRKSR